MAWLSKDKKEQKSAKGGPTSDVKEVQRVESVPTPRVETAASSRDLSHVLRHARITEKATTLEASGVYTFDIAARVSKRDVMQAVRSLYKVTPRKVRVVPVPTKARRNVRTGKTGSTGVSKKAYVYLKRGDTLTLA